MMPLLIHKTLFAVIASFVSTAFAADYNVGECPVLPNCYFAAGQPPVGVYSDTFMFYLGNWSESYGTYQYTSSLDVVVNGVNGIAPCAGRGCRGTPYSVTVDSATLDGAPMTLVSANHWETTISLSPGSHVIAVTGTATGGFGREKGAVQGIQYTLVPNPPVSE
jgi:hypothetical protein